MANRSLRHSTKWSDLNVISIEFYAFQVNVGLLLQTHTCSQDGWSPAGWAPWCLGLNKWCPRPGGQTKSYHVRAFFFFFAALMNQDEMWYRPTAPLPYRAGRANRKHTCTSERTHLDREDSRRRSVSTDNAKISWLLLLLQQCSYHRVQVLLACCSPIKSGERPPCPEAPWKASSSFY